MLSAFIVWLRDTIPPTEEGKQQWEQLTVWLNTPPAAVLASPGTGRQAAIRPPGAPPGAPVDPEAQAAAFAAAVEARPPRG